MNQTTKQPQEIFDPFCFHLNELSKIRHAISIYECMNVSNRIICSTKPIDATFLRRLLALAEKYRTRQICKNLLNTGFCKRNLETFKWKMKSNRSFESLVSELFSSRIQTKPF